MSRFMSSIDVGVMLRSKLNSTDKQISYLYPATRDIDVLLTGMNDDGSGSLAEKIKIYDNKHNTEEIKLEELGSLHLDYDDDTSTLYLRTNKAELSHVTLSTSAKIKLNQPTAVTLVNLDEGCCISWEDPSDIVAGGTTLAQWDGTLIVRKAGAPPISQVDGIIVLDSKTRNGYKDTGFSDVGLVNGVTYYYGIFPYTTANAYNYDTVNEFVPTEIKPGPVSISSITNADAEVVLELDMPSDAMYTNIVYSTAKPSSPNDGEILTHVNSQCVISGLENGVVYYFRAYSFNEKGRYSESDIIEFAPTEILPPVVTDVMVENNDESVILTFTQQTGVAKTTIVYKEGSAPESPEDGTIITNPESLTIIDNLTNGTEYYFAIYTFTSKGRYQSSNIVSIIPVEICPGAPTLELVGEDDCQVILSFTTPDDSTYVRVVYKEGSAPESPEDGVSTTNVSSPYTINNLTNNTTYYFIAYAFNSRGRFTASNIIQGTPYSSYNSWSNGTDEQIAFMLSEHYNGNINIGDYWSVGDTRTVTLSAIDVDENGFESHAEQDIELVIIGIEHDTLVNSIGDRTTAAITVHLKEVLDEFGGQSDAIVWDDTNLRRTWCNTSFKNALPPYISSLIQVVNKPCRTAIYDATVTHRPDSCFFVSEYEVTGVNTYAGCIEGALYEYYETTSNRNKNCGARYWWSRSRKNYEQIMTFDDALLTKSSHNAGAQLGICPAFCL